MGEAHQAALHLERCQLEDMPSTGMKEAAGCLQHPGTEEEGTCLLVLQPVARADIDTEAVQPQRAAGADT